MGKKNQISPNHLLYFEDLKIGERFISENYSITADQIKYFASQFDPQPFHLDEKSAANTYFGKLIASGWHTASITMRLIVECIGRYFVGGLIGKRGEISWPNPTYPNDILHVECEIIGLIIAKAGRDFGIVEIRCYTRNHQQQIVQCLIAEVMLARKLISE